MCVWVRKKTPYFAALITNTALFPDAEQESRKHYVRLTRYLTYAGLCLATCIIFQRSIILAAIIGLAVAAYITTSEYILNSPPKPNTTNFAEQLLKVAG